MRVLITGGTGLLGQALIDIADKAYEINALYFSPYEPKSSKRVKYVKSDIRDKASNRRLFERFKPDVVIHTAGIGSPDYAEKNRQEAWDINVGGTQDVIENCEKIGSAFVYISSNGIYDGEKGKYKEDDEARPINFYGQIKLKGEEITKEAKIKSAIVRPILMYGWNNSFERPNIVTFALSKLKENKKVYAYDDVYTNPLFAESCAAAIWVLVGKDIYDIFNIAGRDTVSVCQLMKKAAVTFGLDADLILPVKQGFFKEVVKRPKDTSYDTEKMRRVLELEPLSLEEGLRRMREAGRNIDE